MLTSDLRLPLCAVFGLYFFAAGSIKFFECKRS